MPFAGCRVVYVVEAAHRRIGLQSRYGDVYQLQESGVASPCNQFPITDLVSMASGSDIRDMTPEAVEKHFGATRAPHAIEHLSDTCSPYTARETRLFAPALNLTPCFAPVASPQSNGISEAFVKTIKRDYIRISIRPDAEAALRQIDGWIKDHTEIHPHFALKMASPRQFIRAKST